MPQRTNKDLVEEVRSIVDKNSESVLYCWCGTSFNDQDIFSRLDKTYLYVLSDNSLTKVVGYSALNEFKETRVIYSIDPAYRIVSGNRKGRVLPPDKIWDDERFESAIEILELEEAPDKTGCLDLTDLHWDIRQLLEDLADNGFTAYPSSLQAPDFYLCTKDRKPILHFRNKGNVISLLKGKVDMEDISHQSIDKFTDVLANDRNFYKDAGDGRKGFPFDTVYGRGVLAADIFNSKFIKWFAVDKNCANLSKDYLMIKLYN